MNIVEGLVNEIKQRRGGGSGGNIPNNTKEHIDDKILRLFRESNDKNKYKICPNNITLSDLHDAMGISKDAQVHIRAGNKQALWSAYYDIMLKYIDVKLPELK